MNQSTNKNNSSNRKKTIVVLDSSSKESVKDLTAKKINSSVKTDEKLLNKFGYSFANR